MSNYPIVHTDWESIASKRYESPYHKAVYYYLSLYLVGIEIEESQNTPKQTTAEKKLDLLLNFDRDTLCSSLLHKFEEDLVINEYNNAIEIAKATITEKYSSYKILVKVFNEFIRFDLPSYFGESIFEPAVVMNQYKNQGQEYNYIVKDYFPTWLNQHIFIAIHFMLYLIEKDHRRKSYIMQICSPSYYTLNLTSKDETAKIGVDRSLTVEECEILDIIILEFKQIFIDTFIPS